MQIIRTPAAETDLIDIWLHIAADSPRAADALLGRIGVRIEQLARHPFSGAARPDIAPDARLISIGNYVALYRVLPDAIEIVRVVHGARDAKALF